jgi:hypothetical protein
MEVVLLRAALSAAGSPASRPSATKQRARGPARREQLVALLVASCLAGACAQVHISRQLTCKPHGRVHCGQAAKRNRDCFTCQAAAAAAPRGELTRARSEPAHRREARTARSWLEQKRAEALLSSLEHKVARFALPLAVGPRWRTPAAPPWRAATWGPPRRATPAAGAVSRLPGRRANGSAAVLVDLALDVGCAAGGLVVLASTAAVLSCEARRARAAYAASSSSALASSAAERE